MKLVKKKVRDLIPYENNPRINDAAVPELIKSIEQCGYVAPIVIDENDVILAGHTRQKALLRMGQEDVECIVVPGLTDEQKKKFRVLDNKTAEIADWDFEMLKEELDGIDLGDVTWFDDLLNPNVKALQPKGTTSSSGGQSEDGPVYCPKCGAMVVDADGNPVGGPDDDEEMPF